MLYRPTRANLAFRQNQTVDKQVTRRLSTCKKALSHRFTHRRGRATVCRAAHAADPPSCPPRPGKPAMTAHPQPPAPTARLRSPLRLLTMLGAALLLVAAWLTVVIDARAAVPPPPAG